jgi:hypothetical protein
VAYPGNSQGGHIHGDKKLTTFFSEANICRPFFTERELDDFLLFTFSNPSQIRSVSRRGASVRPPVFKPFKIIFVSQKGAWPPAPPSVRHCFIHVKKTKKFTEWGFQSSRKAVISLSNSSSLKLRRHIPQLCLL